MATDMEGDSADSYGEGVGGLVERGVSEGVINVVDYIVVASNDNASSSSGLHQAFGGLKNLQMYLGVHI